LLHCLGNCCISLGTSHHSGSTVTLQLRSIPSSLQLLPSGCQRDIIPDNINKLNVFTLLSYPQCMNHVGISHLLHHSQMVSLFAAMRPGPTFVNSSECHSWTGWWCIKVFNFKQVVGMAFSLTCSEKSCPSKCTSSFVLYCAFVFCVCCWEERFCFF